MDESAASGNEVIGEVRPSGRHYSAFISYTSADRAAVSRLQSRLERFRLPRRLAKQLGFDRIKPVFVDRSEMRAAPDIDGAISEALQRSDFLIVACTPHTPKSHWVGREIDKFRELRGNANILVALLEGDKSECFHPRLLVDLEQDREPLAADFRRKGDGYRLALLKIVATLIDANLDDLVHRDATRQRQRTLLLSGIAAALVLIIGTLSFWAWSSDRAVDEGRIQASLAMERQLDELRKQIKAGGTLDMVAAVNRNVELFYDELPEYTGLPEVEMGRAQLLQAKVDEASKRGDMEEASANARKAWNVSSRVLEQEPDNTKAIFVHAQSAYWVGYIAWRMRDTPLAANAFARYADLADRLVKAGPDNSEWRQEQGYAYSNLGLLALSEARDPERAQTYFDSAQAAFREVARRSPDDLDVIYELADGEAWLADVALAKGDFNGARRHRDEQKKLLATLLAQEPQNLNYRYDDVGAQIRRALLDAEQGKHAVAIRQLREAHRAASELLAADPDNASVNGQQRTIELFQARSELALTATDQAALGRARAILDDCRDDRVTFAGNEISAFCGILLARSEIRQGNVARARSIVADPEVADWLGSPSLSPTWRFDFQAECRKLGRPELCKAPRQ